MDDAPKFRVQVSTNGSKIIDTTLIYSESSWTKKKIFENILAILEKKFNEEITKENDNEGI